MRELVTILIFHIFFWGFLYGARPENAVWTVFGVLAILLNIITVSSLFLLEKGNSLYFGLVRRNGRVRFFFSKFLLIFLIDFFWITVFAVIYGIRFWNGVYFAELVPRLVFMAFLMCLSIAILSLAFTYKPWISLLLVFLIIFGGILNKSALFPVESVSGAYALISLVLPPILEIIYSMVTLQFPFWRSVFLGIAFIQLLAFLYLNYKFVLRKDFV